MDPRGILGAYNRGKLIVEMSMEVSHLMRNFLSGGLTLPDDCIQAIALDVGDDFGTIWGRFCED